MNFGVCVLRFFKLSNSFPLVSMGNCFRCDFGQFFVHLLSRKCKIDCKIL